MPSYPKFVTVHEVGPRDGLQNEARAVPTSDKVRFIDALSATGLSRVEITSFVSPKWIPQLSDSSEVSTSISRAAGVHYSALVPNMRGLDNAIKAELKEVAVFLSSSETHNKKNTNKTIDESVAAFTEVIAKALGAGMRVRGYISTVFGCPYEGDVDPAVVVRLSETLLSLGCYEVALGDTVGVANPKQVVDVLGEVLDTVAIEKVAVHMHDTQGTALANVLAAMSLGIHIVDASVGGLGGCPYAPGASGNLATEDLVAMLAGMGIETGIDLDKLVDCSVMASTFIGRELPSKYMKAHVGKKQRAHRMS